MTIYDMFTYDAPPEPDRNSWVDHAICATIGPHLWELPENYPLARTYCAECPVLQECRDYTDRIEGTTGVNHLFLLIAGESGEERWQRRNPNHNQAVA